MGNCVDTGASQRAFRSAGDVGAASAGVFFGTIDNLFDVEQSDFGGAYDDAVVQRRGVTSAARAPGDMKRLVGKCNEAWEEWAKAGEPEPENFWDSILQDLMTFFTGPDDTDAHAEPKVEGNVEELSKKERQAFDKILSIFGVPVQSRAHLLPKDVACYVFWGKIIEMVTGANLDNCIHEQYANWMRKELTQRIVRFKSNRLVLQNSHAAVFDTLETGCVLAIPVLSPAEMYHWENGRGYSILLVCDSALTYSTLGSWTRLPHLKKAQPNDITLATDILSTQVKVLADSLTKHWDNYFSGLTCASSEFPKKLTELTAIKDALIRDGQVGIPSPLPGHEKFKFLKIDLDELYGHDENMARHTPDPCLLAIKAAANWSAFRGGGKLLPACSPDESSEGSVISASDLTLRDFSIPSVVLERLMTERIDRTNRNICGREVRYVSDDDAVSEVSSEGFEPAAEDQVPVHEINAHFSQ